MNNGVTRYMVANGMSELRPPTIYRDVSPFSSFSGNLNANDEFPEESEIMLEFSNASGKRRKGSSKKRSSAKKRRIQASDTRQKGREDRKNKKVEIKQKEAETQTKIAENIGKSSPEEEMMLKQLGLTDKTPEVKKGMSKGLKIGIIVGGVLVVGTAVFLVIRKMRKAKK